MHNKKTIFIISLLLSGCSAMDKQKEKLPGQRIPAYAVSQSVQVDNEIHRMEYKQSEPLMTTWSSSKYPKEAFGHDIFLKLDSLKAKKIYNLNVDRYAPVTTPITSEKYLFILSNNGVLEAIDLKSNKKVWLNKDLIKNPSLSKLISSDKTVFGGMLYHNGSIILTCGMKAVISLDAETGKLKWSKEVSTILRSVPTVSENKVFVQGVNNNVYAIDLDTGELIWSYLGSKGSEIGPLDPAVLAVSGSHIVSSQAGNEIHGLDKETGAEVWRYVFYDLYSGNAELLLAPKNNIQIAAQGNMIYAVHPNGKAIALQADGSLIWELNLSSASHFWISDGLIFFLTKDENAVAVDAKTGKVKWAQSLTQFITINKKGQRPAYIDQPIVINQAVIVFSSNGLAHKLDFNTGKYLGVTTISKSISNPVIVSNGDLFIADKRGLTRMMSE